MRMKTAKCKGCEFYGPFLEKYTKGEVGHCRINPPTFDILQPSYPWPEVIGGKDWCGQWARKVSENEGK